MNILQIHNYYAIRGGECAVVDAERSLLESRGHVVDQYMRSSQGIDGSPTHRKVYDYAAIAHNARVERELLCRLEQTPPDVAHVHNVFPLLSPSVYAALKKQGVPIVQTVHNFRFLCPNGTFFVRGQICERCQEKGFKEAVRLRCVRNSLPTSIQYARAISRMWRNRTLTEGVDRFIALNYFSKKKLVESGIPDQKIDICGNFTTEVGSPSHSKEGYVLFLGRLSPEKGVQTLIEAARKLRVGRIKVAGLGPLEGQVRSAAEEIQKLEFVGYVAGRQKVDLIQRACAMVVPSEWYENFPISVVESMSLGTPVIASDTGGLPEMFDDGESGILFEPGSSVSLARHIEHLCTDMMKAEVMSKAAWSHAQKEFGSDKHGEELERIFQNAVSERNSVPVGQYL